jgi:hypothetical protein
MAFTEQDEWATALRLYALVQGLDHVPTSGHLDPAVRNEEVPLVVTIRQIAIDTARIRAAVEAGLVQIDPIDYRTIIDQITEGVVQQLRSITFVGKIPE